jgi:hypothetical protein
MSEKIQAKMTASACGVDSQVPSIIVLKGWQDCKPPLTQHWLLTSK